MTRRELVGGALTAASVVTGAPALLRGRNLNDKLNMAFIACGGRATASPKALTVTPGRDPGKSASVDLYRHSPPMRRGAGPLPRVPAVGGTIVQKHYGVTVY